jgi:hypothetical protein
MKKGGGTRNSSKDEKRPRQPSFEEVAHE